MSKNVYRNKGFKDNIVISIAGAHSVGKTTIYNLLKKEVGDNSKFKFFPERYKKIPPFSFGSKDKQIAFRSEIHFLQQLIKRNRSVLHFDERYNGRILIMDRTPLCVLIYSKSLNLKEKDYQLIFDTYKSIEWREDYIIYLTAAADTILKRSLEKIRKEWNETEKSYLLTILSYYNQFLSSNDIREKVFIIDTDKLTPEQVIEEIQEIFEDLTGCTSKKSFKPPKAQMSLFKFLKENK